MKPLLLLLLLFAVINNIRLPQAQGTIPQPVLLTGTESDTVKHPVVQLQEIYIDTMNLVVIRDTADNSAELNMRLGRDYGELFTFINQSHLLPGKIMAFYYTSHWPFIFEAAVQTDKLPYCTKGRVKINKLPAGNALVAQYKGPYSQISIAYTALEDWLSAHNKKANGYPFEVYVSDPLVVKDSFELRTDVYQLLRE